MIASKCAKERMKSSLIEEFVRRTVYIHSPPLLTHSLYIQAWQTRLLTRPILTGSYVRPNLHNGPLPRFHKDPEHIRMMIHKRRVAHNRRGEKYAVLQELKEDLKNEGIVWQKLGVDDDISGYSTSFYLCFILVLFTDTVYSEPQSNPLVTTKLTSVLPSTAHSVAPKHPTHKNSSTKSKTPAGTKS